MRRYVGKNPKITKLRRLQRDVTVSCSNLIALAAADHYPFVVVVETKAIHLVDYGKMEIAVDLNLYIDKTILQTSYSIPCRTYWSEQHSLLAAFLIDTNSVETIGDPEMKTMCNKNDLMISSSIDCGYCIDPHSSLVGMFKSLLRECNRLKIHGIGYRHDSFFKLVEMPYEREHRYSIFMVF